LPERLLEPDEPELAEAEALPEPFALLELELPQPAAMSDVAAIEVARATRPRLLHVIWSSPPFGMSRRGLLAIIIMVTLIRMQVNNRLDLEDG
jgi:hypothetical protein